MTKLKYPEFGLIKTEQTTLESITQNINALTGINFTIPSGISDYVLENFSNITKDFSQEFRKIKESLTRADKNYSTLDNQIQNQFKQITVEPIPQRTKII